MTAQGDPSALDARVAELLVARGLLAPSALGPPQARAAGRAPGPSGSALLDVLVELNLVPRAAAIQVLQQARAAAPAPDDRAQWTSAGAPAPAPQGDRTQWTAGGGPGPSAPAPTGDRTQWAARAAPAGPLGAAPPSAGDPGRPPAPLPDRTRWTGRVDPVAAPIPSSDATRWTQGAAGAVPGPGAAPAPDRTHWEEPSSTESARTSAGPRPPRWSEGQGRAAAAPPTEPDAEERTRWEVGADDRTLQTPARPGDVTYDPGAMAAAAAAAAMASSAGAEGGARDLPEARYELLDEPAPGQHRVLDLRLQRTVIMLVAGPAAERRLARHARLLAQLDHPAIPRVHDAFRWEDRPAFTTDEVEGAAFGAAPDLGQAALLRAFLDVAAAVAHAHERGLVHGTLGSARVVVGTFGRAWVTGWEGARALPRAPAAVTRAAADLEAAPPPPDAPRAPEVMDGDTAGTPADVWGLGRLLERVVVRAGKAAAPELRAIARKACARRPDDRYDSAADLAEDVRRHLDGKAVGALRETPLGALRRVAKRHPAAASVASAALAVVLGSGVVTLALTRRSYALSRALADEARAQDERAATLLAAARSARDAALARTGVAERRVELERVLRVPEQGLDDPEAARAAQLQRAGELLIELEREAQAAGGLTLDTTFTAARVHRARAEHHLRGSARPDPARALEELRALIALLEGRLRRAPVGDAGGGAGGDAGGGASDPFDEETLARAQLADAQLDRFLAARRLPGAAARDEELAALDVMGELEETRELARLERAVRRLEEEARLLAARRPPEAVAEDLELLAAIDARARARPDLAYAHELRGRLRVALSVPGVHRDHGAAAGRHQWDEAFGAFLRASYLDPTEPEPRVGYLEVWNAKFALHFPWRFIGGWALGNALRAAQLTPRPEPMLRVARLLTLLERPAATGGLLSPWDEEVDLRPEVRAAVELYRVRAALAGGAQVAPARLARLDVPGDLVADKRALLGWALLRAGEASGFEELMGALRTPPGPSVGLHDFEDALCDPLVEPRLLLPLLDQAVPPPEAGADESPVVHALLLARALARARAGQPDRTGDLPRLERVNPQVNAPTRAGARFALAAATSAARQQPQQPAAHVNALLVWARLNLDVGSTEAEVAQARDLIVARLRALGAREQAAQFEGFDAIDEVYVRRAWMPPEIMPWRAPGGPR